MRQPVSAGEAPEVRIDPGLPEQQQEGGRGRGPAEAEETRQEGRSGGRSCAAGNRNQVRLFAVNSHAGVGNAGANRSSAEGSRLGRRRASLWQKQKQKTQR